MQESRWQSRMRPPPSSTPTARRRGGLGRRFAALSLCVLCRCRFALHHSLLAAARFSTARPQRLRAPGPPAPPLPATPEDGGLAVHQAVGDQPGQRLPLLAVWQRLLDEGGAAILRTLPFAVSHRNALHKWSRVRRDRPRLAPPCPAAPASCSGRRRRRRRRPRRRAGRRLRPTCVGAGRTAICSRPIIVYIYTGNSLYITSAYRYVENPYGTATGSAERQRGPRLGPAPAVRVVELDLADPCLAALRQPGPGTPRAARLRPCAVQTESPAAFCLKVLALSAIHAFKLPKKNCRQQAIAMGNCYQCYKISVYCQFSKGLRAAATQQAPERPNAASVSSTSSADCSRPAKAQRAQQ